MRWSYYRDWSGERWVGYDSKGFALAEITTSYPQLGFMVRIFVGDRVIELSKQHDKSWAVNVAEVELRKLGKLPPT